MVWDPDGEKPSGSFVRVWTREAVLGYKSSMFEQHALIRLFVYGTLMPGYPPHAQYCQGATVRGPAWVYGRLFQLPEGYPGLVLSDYTEAAESSFVHGFLLELPEECLEGLDDYEEVRPDGTGPYLRCITTVYGPAGGDYAWTYCLRREPAEGQIPSGIWPVSCE